MVGGGREMWFGFGTVWWSWLAGVGVGVGAGEVTMEAFCCLLSRQDPQGPGGVSWRVGDERLGGGIRPVG